MLPVAQEPALVNPADSHVPVKQHASPYLPESKKTRFLMLACALLTCVSLFGPEGDLVTVTGRPWRIDFNTVNMGAWLGPPLPDVTLGLGILLIVATLCWGHGFRGARWLGWIIAFATLILMALGMIAALEIGLILRGGLRFSWGMALVNPATGLAFVLNIVYGARRSLIPYRGDIRS